MTSIINADPTSKVDIYTDRIDNNLYSRAAIAATVGHDRVTASLKQDPTTGRVMVDVCVNGMFICMVYVAEGGKFFNVYQEAIKYIGMEENRT